MACGGLVATGSYTSIFSITSSDFLLGARADRPSKCGGGKCDFEINACAISPIDSCASPSQSQLFSLPCYTRERDSVQERLRRIRCSGCRLLTSAHNCTRSEFVLTGTSQQMGIVMHDLIHQTRTLRGALSASAQPTQTMPMPTSSTWARRLRLHHVPLGHSIPTEPSTCAATSSTEPTGPTC